MEAFVAAVVVDTVAVVVGVGMDVFGAHSVAVHNHTVVEDILAVAEHSPAVGERTVVEDIVAVGRSVDIPVGVGLGIERMPASGAVVVVELASSSVA